MTEHEEASPHPKPRLTEPGIKVVVGTAMAPLTEGILFFGAAGNLTVSRGWLFLLLCFIGIFGQIALVALVNPDLVNRRGLWRKRTDTKPWDKTLILAYGLLAFYATPIVMGLDVGRFHWSSLGTWSEILGVALFALGTVLITWAMLINKHFETTVRIQRDRDHKVITAGPYGLIRHPGYAGASLWVLATPLIVGSAFGLIPAALAVGAIVARARREDALLHRELGGYADYAAHVRWRLLPGIW